MADGYFFKWDNSNKKWLMSTDGGSSFVDLVENLTTEKIKFNTGADPGGGVGRAWYDGTDLNLGPSIKVVGDAFFNNDAYFKTGKLSSDPILTLDNNDYLLYDRSENVLQMVINGAVTDLTPILFQRGGTVINPNGILAGINVISWYAPYACTVKNVRGYRVGGTGATINARKNGSSNHLSSALSLTSTDTWMDGGSVTNATYAAGDKLEIMLVSVTGSPTQVGIQVDFSRP